MLQRKGLRNVPAWQTPTYHLQIHKLVEILGTCIQLLEGGNFVNRERDHSNNRSGMFSTVMAACCAVFCHSFWFILATSSMELIVFIKYSSLLLCPIICLSLATTRVKLSTSRGREKTSSFPIIQSQEYSLEFLICQIVPI